MMMKTILSKHSMRTLFTGYIKEAGDLVVVLLSVGQGLIDLEPKPKVRI